MQISKRVIESATVLVLALAMVITAVTSNGVYAVSDTQTAENTQLEENGLAGFAVAMNEYEDAQITLELAEETEYEISINGKSAGTMKTNLGGKLSLSVELGDVDAVEIKVEQR